MQLPIFTCFLTDEIWLLEPYKAKSRWLAIGHNPGCNTFLKLPKPLCRIITKKELSKRIRKILFRVLYAPCSDFSSKVLFGSRGKHDATGQNHAVRFRRCAIQTKSRNKFFFPQNNFETDGCWSRQKIEKIEMRSLPAVVRVFIKDTFRNRRLAPVKLIQPQILHYKNLLQKACVDAQKCFVSTIFIFVCLKKRIFLWCILGL